ncbi:hypothetical protein J2X53_004011 [Pseudorhodobacter sp. 4114]|nr:hypothetical protein [Pseudorhodobacter sp. 4114]
MDPQQVAPAAPDAPAAPGEEPRIDLAPPVPEAGGTQTVAPPEPMDRDVGAPATPTEAPTQSLPPAGWMIALTPAAQTVPTEVRIGISMPAPRQFRLSGENANADFLLTLPDGVAPPSDLRLALRSSVNVLPEASTLAVRINDTDAGTITLDTFGEFSEKILPTAALVAGVNRISLRAVQSHRIFCGPEASFGVWTEVDLGNSGVLMDPAQVPLNAQGFLAAMQSQVARGGAVEIVVDDATDVGLIRDVASRITDMLGGAPRLEVMPFYAMQAGPEARARIALINAPLPKASVRRGAGGAVVLQIEHAGKEAPDLSMMLPERPSEWGVPALTPGRPTLLAELGAGDVLANTHYFRKDIDFLLPEDWLLLASQKAEFTLHYGFSGGLAEGALLLVKINGETIRLLPLDRDGGQVQPPLDIIFRANRLNPGINTLTLEMSVPGDPADLPCTPRSTDMLVVLSDSTLNVPPSPKMQQADMSRSLSRLGGADVSIPSQVAASPAGSAALLAFAALLRPLVTDGSKANLYVVGLDTVGLVPTGETGVTRRMLQNAVYPALEATIAPAVTPQAPPETPGYSLATADGVSATADPVAPDQDVSPQPDSGAFAPYSWAVRKLDDMRTFLISDTIPLVDWLTDKSGQALLLQLDPETPDDIWLVAGPNITMTELARQVDEFRRSGRSQAHVQAALLQGDGTWVTWSEMRRPVLLEALSPSNIRAVLGNYASWSPLIFMSLTLFLALLSVIPALLFVLMTRRSGSRT